MSLSPVFIRPIALAFKKKSEKPFARLLVEARVGNRKKSKNKTTPGILCKFEKLALKMRRLRTYFMFTIGATPKVDKGKETLPARTGRCGF